MNLSRKCRKFQKIYLRKVAGEISHKEQLLWSQHRDQCPTCQNMEQEVQGIREILKQEEIFCAPSEDFATRVLRALRHDRLRRQLQVWKPTLIGAGVTAIALASILQVLTTELHLTPPPTGTANRQILSSPQSETRLFIPEIKPKQKEPSVEG